MFQFTGFASLAGYYTFSIVGCPIRIPADHIVCADPHSFSQLIASFIASESLGIPHTPLFSLSPFASYSNLLVLYVPSLLFKFVFSRVYINCLFLKKNNHIYSTIPICQWTFHLLLNSHPINGAQAVSWSLKKDPSGEYRSRTDDLLRARQAL